MEKTCQPVLTKGLRKVRCLVLVEVEIGWGFNPMNLTFASNFSSVEVWINLVSSPFRVIVEKCPPLFILNTGRMWYLRCCLGWLNICLSNLSGYYYGSGEGGLKFSSSVCYGRSSVIIAVREENNSCFPIGWVGIGYKWTVIEVTIPDESVSERGISEREEAKFPEADELGCPCWRNNAAIELHVDLVLEKDDVFIDLDRHLHEWVTVWKESGNILFDDFLG